MEVQHIVLLYFCLIPLDGHLSFFIFFSFGVVCHCAIYFSYSWSTKDPEMA